MLAGANSGTQTAAKLCPFVSILSGFLPGRLAPTDLASTCRSTFLLEWRSVFESGLFSEVFLGAGASREDALYLLAQAWFSIVITTASSAGILALLDCST